MYIYYIYPTVCYVLYMYMSTKEREAMVIAGILKI